MMEELIMKKALSFILCLILVLGCFPLTAMADDTTISGNGETGISLTTVVPELASISVTPPTKTQYNVGDALDTTGMVVTATYTDGSTKDVTSAATLSGFDSSAAGEVTVTVSYTENDVTKSASFTVTIVTAYTVSLSANPAEGGTVTGAGSYSDGETVTVSASANGGYRFDHWTRGDGTEIDDASFTFVIHENRTYEAVFVEDSSNIAKYTLEMPDSVAVSPNEEFTAATANLTELIMATGTDGRTPIRLRVILGSGTLTNQTDNSKTISFHPDSSVNTLPTLNQCMLDFTAAENRTFYIRIVNSEWDTASPGTYTGTMSYIVRWLYEGNIWSGDIETGTIPITVTIPETTTEYTVTVQPGEGIGTAFTVQSTTVISRSDFISGNYDQSQGCFYLDDDEKVYYALPTQCPFTAPNDKEFDCWECSFGGTFTGGTSFDIASTGDFTITALWKNQPQNSVTLSIPATINVNYGDTQTAFDVQVKSVTFQQGDQTLDVSFWNSSFSNTENDGTIPFTVTTNGQGPGSFQNGCTFFVYPDTTLPYSCQAFINISSDAWAAAKPGSYTATLRISVEWQ